MSFKENLQRLAVQILERKGHITNEETTKQALIIPFLQVLGYDVFNPLEIKPEYVSDFGRKKGEKVDYAIFKDGKPIIFIEAKSVTENLNLHGSQLARYFNATPEVKLAILTNGITYKLYSDIDTDNIMDETPFASVDVTELNQNDIEILSKIRKEAFETESIVIFAEELIYTSNINNKLRELFRYPADEFVRYLVKDLSDTKITSNVIERFRPIVKKAISSTLLEIVTEGLTKEKPEEQDIPVDQLTKDDEPETNDDEDNGSKNKPVVFTSEEELKGFEIIKEILSEHQKDVSNIGYKDTTVYFAVFKRSINYWFMRLRLDNQNPFLLTRLPVDQATQFATDCKVEAAPKGYGESRIYISGIDDLVKLDKLILECFESVK